MKKIILIMIGLYSMISCTTDDKIIENNNNPSSPENPWRNYNMDFV